MSVAIADGDLVSAVAWEVSISSLQSRANYKPSFLSRNVRKFMMGSNSSKERSSGEKTLPEELSHATDEDDEGPRPAKRRRTKHGSIATSTTLNQMTSDRNRARKRPNSGLEAVHPSDFYGSSSKPTVDTRHRSASGKKPAGIDEILRVTQPPVKHTKALWVNIVGIESELGFSKSVKINCQCIISIFAKPDNHSDHGQSWEEVGRWSQKVVLRPATNENGRSFLKFHGLSLGRFCIPADEIFINRPRNRRGKTTTVRDLAEGYNLKVWLEHRDDLENWPPVHISAESSLDKALADGTAQICDVKLLGNFSGLMNLREPTSRDILLGHGRSTQRTKSKLTVDLRWSLPNHLSEIIAQHQQNTTESSVSPIFEKPVVTPRKSLEVPQAARKSIEPSLTPLESAENIQPESPAEVRSHRQRCEKNYNLKRLSKQSVGLLKDPSKPLRSPAKNSKTPEIRLIHESSSSGLSKDEEQLTVIYSLGDAQSAELGSRRQTEVAGLTCAICQSSFESIGNLRLHLSSRHPGFIFKARRLIPPRLSFFVVLKEIPRRRQSNADAKAVIQLGRPKSLLDVEAYLNGDDLWTKAREGPDHTPDRLSTSIHESSQSSSPRDSRHSSPNTSEHTDDLMDYEPVKAKLPVRTRKRHVVPWTNKPLYDAVTKRVLEPGEEVPDSDEEKDETWLHQKQRDVILDFSDVSAEEKDYILKWNPFMMDEQLTTENFVREVVLEFAQNHKTWFAQKKSRKVEFCKHLETFILRGIISQEDFHKCAATLRQGEKEAALRKQDAMDMDMDMDEPEEPKSPHKFRGLMDCECCEQTQPPDRIICQGPKCSGRFFHRSCAEKQGRPLTGAWRCSGCLQ